MSQLVPQIIPGDWHSVQNAISKLSTVRLGPYATPTFAGLNITDNVVVGGSVTVSGTLNVTGSVTFSGGLTLGGTLNLQCNEIQNFRVHLVADEAAMLALSCGEGQMCFRQDVNKFYGRLE